MFRTSVWMRTKRVFSWDDGMFNTVMAAGWQDWEWSMIRWRCFRSLINSTLSHSRRRIRPWTKYSVFVKTDKCICSDLRSVWSTLSEDTDLTLNILMPVIRHATQWYGPYHTAATRSVMTLSSDTMASRISDISAALCSCTVYATHCFRRRIIMSVWKCDTVCVYWQSVSLEWPTNRLDFDHHPTSLQYLVNSINGNLMFPCFQVTGAWTNPSPHCGGTTYPARRPISLWRWGSQTLSSFLSQKQ